MAYFLKDREEGEEIKEPVVPAHNTRSQTSRVQQQQNRFGMPPQRSVTRIVAPKLKLVNGQVVVEEAPAPTVQEDLTAGMTVVHEEQNRYFTSATYGKRVSGPNRWSIRETDLFFEALAMCGTDFSMVATLFPHRNRNQIKGKFKIEERSNPHKISAALANKKTLDVHEFKAKLDRILGNKN
jgi:hypothetical protein